MSRHKKIAVIGGGASGLIASLFASGPGNEVVLFEKQKALGRKILVTGNGRCNISNTSVSEKNYHGKNTQIVSEVLKIFSQQQTMLFFESIGIPFVEGKNGKLYPASLQASSVVKIFEYELSKKNVDVRLHRRIDRIIPEKNGFRLLTAGDENFHFDSVILSAGSCAYSPAGASRIGYDLAKSLGHRVIEPFPSILPVNISPKSLHRLQGIKWDCGLRVISGDKIFGSTEGELLFTAYGLSGPAGLDISRAANQLVISGKKCFIEIDFFPGIKSSSLEKIVSGLWNDKDRTVSFSLAGLIKERMPEVIIELAGVDHNKKIGELTDEEKSKIISALKSLRVYPGEPRQFTEAVAAAGGVDTSEIVHSTMESKLVKNLFITGELLDIDGESGGYNLQFAWSTGAAAGMSQHKN